MVIIRLMGGLGNQLFQYALGFQLQQEGIAVKMDEVTAQSFQHKRNVQLDKLGIAYEVATAKEIEEFLDSSMFLPKRILRKLRGRKSKLIQEKSLDFDETFLASDDKYFSGYFQTEKYFKKYANELKKNISIQSVPLSEQSAKFREQIISTKSVGIHIRRGDYVSQDFKDIYGGICTELYYKKAIQYMREQIENPTFYIFSNDPEWCRTKYPESDFVVVDCNDEEQGYMDLALMSLCEHNIIANSSFSWWASWLNENEDKIIIAPSKWNNTQECKDVWSQDMRIKIDAQGNICG